jgi:hypothetical protein
MSSVHCQRESEVLEACRSSLWDPTLRRHARRCAACAEVSLVAEFLLHEAESAASDAPLPTPDLIWWRTQLAAKNAALARATRPITLITGISSLAGAFCLLWLSSLSFENAASDGGSRYPTYLQHLLSLSANSTSLMMTTGMLLCLLFGSLYLVWRE